MTAMREAAELAERPLSDNPYDWLPVDDISQALERSGYIVLPNIIPEAIRDELIQAAEIHATQFRPAAIGRGSNEHRNVFVRRDKIAWMAGDDPNVQHWFAAMRALRLGLNRRLFLGLWDFECHFAQYRSGDFYARHYDAFRGRSNRRVSLVAYLNRGWEPDQGGQLVLYPEGFGAKPLTITPQMGTIVLFLAEEMLHEVLPVSRDRYSVAGWFRVNDTLDNRVDPLD